MSGEWLIRQAGTPITRQGVTVPHHETERVTIETDKDGRPTPRRRESTWALRFEWPDGRELIFPWNNILRAEYRPHTEP